MKVYLVEKGVYADKYVVGVYSTLEKAMAGFDGVWRQDDVDGSWWNGLSWDRQVTIEECEVDENKETT